jgi:SAM-dependent methyltransferase
VRVACFRCPACGGALNAGSAARCRACGREFAEQDGVLVLGSSLAAEDGYDPKHYALLAAVDRDHFWYRARRRAVLESLRRVLGTGGDRALMEVGCGAGCMLEAFQAAGWPVAGGCDGHLEGLLIARQRSEIPLAQVDPTLPMPLAPNQRLVGLFDVLEHVADDVGFLRGLADCLAPDGALVLTVPAHMWLFDDADRIACHQRRYSASGLRQVLVRGGLAPVWVSSFGISLVLPLLVNRRVGRLLQGRRGAEVSRARELSIVRGLNGVLDAMLSVEWKLLGRFEVALGTSLLAIAKRVG